MHRALVQSCSSFWATEGLGSTSEKQACLVAVPDPLQEATRTEAQRTRSLATPDLELLVRTCRGAYVWEVDGSGCSGGLPHFCFCRARRSATRRVRAAAPKPFLTLKNVQHVDCNNRGHKRPEDSKCICDHSLPAVGESSWVGSNCTTRKLLSKRPELNLQAQTLGDCMGNRRVLVWRCLQSRRFTWCIRVQNCSFT